MTFYDAVNASECRCAVRVVKGRRLYRYWDGKIEMETKQGWRYWKFFERHFRARTDTSHTDWEPVGLGPMAYDEAITRLQRAEARARSRIVSCLLPIGIGLLASGCALAPLVAGLIVDATVGGVGIYQRAEHKDELVKLNAELVALRQAMIPQLRTTSDRLREER